MTEELKPCPFCGNELISVGWTYSHRTYVGGDITTGVYWTIRCRCGATMLVRMRSHDDYETDFPTATEASRIATERWNKRAMEIRQD